MKIVVLIKQVPDTTEVRLDPRTGTLIREGVPSIINPEDKNALEEALKLKETMGLKLLLFPWARRRLRTPCGKHWPWAQMRRFC